jgi:hypothetical protein
MTISTSCCSRRATASIEDPRADGIGLLRYFRTRSSFPAVLPLPRMATSSRPCVHCSWAPWTTFQRLLTPERLGTAVRLALRRVERRAARRQAKLALSGEHAAAAAAAAAMSAPQPEQTEPEATDAPDTVPADLVPGYAIRSLIGESEKASVYLAVSEALGREIALKVSSVESDEPGGHHLLAREYEAVSGIRHPAIVELHDYGVHAGREYLAMSISARRPEGAHADRHQRTRSAALGRAHASALRIVHHAASCIVT